MPKRQARGDNLLTERRNVMGVHEPIECREIVRSNCAPFCEFREQRSV
jgi:hypothetical protein